jgi:hypothetical protein
MSGVGRIGRRIGTASVRVGGRIGRGRRVSSSSMRVSS